MKTIGIYLLKKNEEIVYVGQSIDIDLRIKTHKKEAIKEFDSIHIIKCSRENLDSAEAFYIHYYMPKYNKKLYEIRVETNPPRTNNFKQKTKTIFVSNFNKPTNINLANYYGLTRQTIATYKKSKQHLYNAMLEYFIKQHET